MSKIKKISSIVFVQLALLVVLIFIFSFFTPKILGTQAVTGMTFFKFENAQAILVDDNPEFTSPLKISEEGTILTPGKYYWKAIGLFGESEVGNFTIDSEVVIVMKIENNRTVIENKGNVPVELTKKSPNSVTGGAIVDVNENVDFTIDSNDSNELNIIFEGKGAGKNE